MAYPETQLTSPGLIKAIHFIVISMKPFFSVIEIHNLKDITDLRRGWNKASFLNFSKRGISEFTKIYITSFKSH